MTSAEAHRGRTVQYSQKRTTYNDMRNMRSRELLGLGGGEGERGGGDTLGCVILIRTRA